MSVERRLTNALKSYDVVDPSPDLFARVNLSIEEDRNHRRRVWRVAVSIAVAVAISVGYWTLVVDRVTGVLLVEVWQGVLFDLAVMGVLIVVLAPNIRRFARGYVDGIFRLAPETGVRFLAVLDVAYYLTFAGLALVDIDSYGPLDASIRVVDALNLSAERIGFVLLAMGILHALNIALLPLLGAIANSLTRQALRQEAGDSAPPESARARAADRNARALAIAVVVFIAAVPLALLGAPGFGSLLTGFLP